MMPVRNRIGAGILAWTDLMSKFCRISFRTHCWTSSVEKGTKVIGSVSREHLLHLLPVVFDPYTWQGIQHALWCDAKINLTLGRIKTLSRHEYLSCVLFFVYSSNGVHELKQLSDMKVWIQEDENWDFKILRLHGSSFPLLPDVSYHFKPLRKTWIYLVFHVHEGKTNRLQLSI